MAEEDQPDLKLVSPVPLPKANEAVLPNAVLGIGLFIMAETMMFGGFISAHGIAKAAVSVWPPPGQPRLPVEATAFSTLALLVSGGLIYYAGKKFAESPESAKRPFLVSVLLGGLFLTMQGTEWVRLLGDGMTVATSNHAGFFYLIVGMHALHAIGGLTAMIYLYVQLVKNKLDNDSFQAGRVFWYFVTGLWPILYVTVYL